MKFYAKKGSFYERYFGTSLWVKVSPIRYLFERFVMFNPNNIATQQKLKARGFDLSIKIQKNECSYNDQKEFQRIQELNS